MARIKCFLLESVEEAREVRPGVFAPLYRMPDGSLTTLADAPAGAMTRETWAPGRSQDGGAPLIVKLPDGDLWYVDDRASNCGRPDDNTHHCWIRHGVLPDITVDKNGDTCSAGAGSIMSTAYHGFLRGGYLED